MLCPKCKSDRVMRVSKNVYHCLDCHIYVKPEWEPADHMLNHIESFCNKYPNASSGPAHIVLDDYNLGDVHVLDCQNMVEQVILHRLGAQIDDPDEVVVSLNYYGRKESDGTYQHSLTELAATYEFLEFLLTIPEDKRDILNG